MKQNQKLEARYGLFMAISMVVGQVIGLGIFFKIDDVLITTNGNVYAGLLGFLIVGIGVVFAAISMTNYTKLFPGNGGILNYVECRFGKKAGAYVGWVYFTLFFPLLAAVLLTVSGIYISHFLVSFIDFEPDFLHYSLIGLFNGFALLGLNIFKPKVGGIFQQMTVVLKLLPLILIAALGIISLIEGDSKILEVSQNNQIEAENISFWLLVAASFIPISFSMDGWYTALQISGEIKNSQKNMPRALLIGTIVVLLVYVFYYLGVISKLSVGEIKYMKDTYITEFARNIGADMGVIIMQLFIIISVLGTCNGLVLANIRIPYQFYHLEASKKFWNLGKIDSKTQMPINSAFVAFILIIFYLFLYYLTNNLSFFVDRQYDISAIPIIFIYIVNMALFLGLIKLFKEGKLQGSNFFKYIMLLFAILGTGIVLIGSFLSPNGLSYLVITIIFMLLGRFVIKNKV